MRIREEIYRLEKELNNPDIQADLQSAQASTENNEPKVILNPARVHLQ